MIFSTTTCTMHTKCRLPYERNRSNVHCATSDRSFLRSQLHALSTLAMHYNKKVSLFILFTFLATAEPCHEKHELLFLACKRITSRQNTMEHWFQTMSVHARARTPHLFIFYLEHLISKIKLKHIHKLVDTHRTVMRSMSTKAQYQNHFKRIVIAFGLRLVFTLCC